MIVVTMVLLLFVSSSCRPETPEPPYGIWLSENPRIVLYFTPEYRLPVPSIHYLALFTIDDVEIKAVAHFGPGRLVVIDDIRDTRGIGGGRSSYTGTLIGGSYQLVGNEIHFRPSEHCQERLGVRRIIFHRIDDYEPIDPYYWYPEFFPRLD